ncbi:hypothetical protein GCM10023329_39370 [Streptomyces sanyensis]|uniref:Transposase n=1 Tax=Streptomyces sanyensis TaxID=568869 RepID=A0ABP9AQW0_9ACTN
MGVAHAPREVLGSCPFVSAAWWSVWGGLAYKLRPALAARTVHRLDRADRGDRRPLGMPPGNRLVLRTSYYVYVEHEWQNRNRVSWVFQLGAVRNLWKSRRSPDRPRTAQPHPEGGPGITGPPSVMSCRAGSRQR